MSYLVLARKYRPKTFAEMVGQEHVVQALVNALQSQRLHHAYLFTGTRGIGKTTVSRILAKSLNCIGADGTGGITTEPCGQCAACEAIDAGRFVDYTELDAASNRGVDEVQALLEQAVYKPVQGRFKVFMIDEVHMLSNTAFNAMLKTLEEPPEYLKFVLATTDPQKVPITVLSRCLQFNLRPMAPETILAHLQKVFEHENVQAEPKALALLARAAQGSMRDALSLCDQAIAYGSGSVQETDVRSMLGCVDSSYVFGIIEALQQLNAAAVIDTVHALRQQGVSSMQVLEDMAGILQRMTVQQWLPPDARQADPTDLDAAHIATLADAFPADATQLLYSMCIHGRNELGYAPDEYAGLTMILLRFFAFHPEAEKKNLTPAPQQTPALTPTPKSSDNADTLPSTASDVPAVQIATQTQKNVHTLPTAPPAEQATVAVCEVDNCKADAAAEQALASIQALEIEDTSPSVISAKPELSEPAPVSTTPNTISTPDTFTPTELGTVWNTIAHTLKALPEEQQLKGLAQALLMQSQLMQQQATQWLLQVAHKATNHEASRKKLEHALAAHCGHNVQLQIQYGSVHDTPALRQKAAQLQAIQHAQDTLMQQPFVRMLVQDFDAQLMPDSVHIEDSDTPQQLEKSV